MSGPYHPDPDDRFAAICAAAFNGDAQAQFRMGEILRRGLFNLSVDESQSLVWYRRAAEAGHGSAIFVLNNWRNRHQFV